MTEQEGAKELLLKNFADKIATEYDELMEISLAEFDGWDMIEFAQQYHQHRMKELFPDDYVEYLESVIFPLAKAIAGNRSPATRAIETAAFDIKQALASAISKIKEL